MTQGKYVQDLLCKVGIIGFKSSHTPLLSTLNIRATGAAVFDDSHLYQSVVGSLQYLTTTRLKLLYSVNKVVQFMQNPLEDHWKLVKKILRCVCDTATYGLKLSKDNSMLLSAYCNSDWRVDPSDRKLIGSFFEYLGKNLTS
ncbi:uncharacterized mitochondrial protein AtMg00810-like [Arachis hypogaea]|uniref:uncharacterized mitochondrial protein AtMg00810-like n=1 Tax=Arachis hypogaea TaxID=3818 RepID=UPI0007875C1B